MNLCIISNGSSPHTRKWIVPLISEIKRIHLISYTRVEQKLPQVETVDLTKISKLKVIKFLLWGIWSRRYIREIKPDIVHAHQIQGAGWLGSMSNHHPFILSAWGSDLYNLNIQPKIIKFISWKAINSCNRFVVPSQHMRKAALSQGIPSKKLVVIPWGIDHNTFTSECQDKIQSRIALGLPPDMTLALSPRALTPTYNIDTIISACSNLTDRVKEFKLLILKFNPDPDYYRYLQKLIKETHLDPHIIWIEQINDAISMAQLYSASDLLISIPSSEGYGLSVYEAMSCACPAVISDLDAFSNLTDRYHCLKVAPRDSSETADAVSELIINTHLRDQIINNSLEFISEMSVDHQKKAALDLYNSVLS